MFTGLIEATGRIERVDSLVHRSAEREGGQPPDRVLRVRTPLGGELKPGGSIAVSGVCLTVSSSDSGGFEAVVSPETLRVTTLLTASEGRLVNLERPLRADGRFGGHFVLGHVDGVGRVTVMRPDGDCHWLEVETPAALGALIIHKGSIAVDGVPVRLRVRSRLCGANGDWTITDADLLRCQAATEE